MDKAELKQVLDAARRFGITIITFNTPAHSHWIGRVYPNLTEDEATGLLCTRNPDTKALIEEMLAELHEVFGGPDFVYIGHDEIGFKTIESTKLSAVRDAGCPAGSSDRRPRLATPRTG